MAKLPFVVEPRRKPILEKIGSESSGVIEVERRGYLTTGEKAFVQQVQQFDNGTTEIVTVSRRVARKYSLGMDRAYNIVIGIISGAASASEDPELVSKIEEEFAEDMTAVVKGLAAGQVREDLVLAACILKYRVDNDFSIEEINSVHPDIIEGLAALYRDEDRRSLDAFKEEVSETEGEASASSVEEAEKKHEKATRSRSKSITGD
jgi:hypothetical protein